MRSWTDIASLALPYDGTNIATREDIIPTTAPTSALPTHAPSSLDATVSPPSLLIAALPEFKTSWDHDMFTYTDGSKKPSSPLLGAGVFHAPSGTKYILNASGHDENHTINRAELIAIHFALDKYAEEDELHILTDSMCCILKLQAALLRPRTVLYDPHALLVAAIIGAI